jgi:NTP pyrophosphatase (non-canonical NTP hydrolase)
MNLNEYQDKAITTAVYPEEFQIAYPMLGLVEELGELFDTNPEDKESVVKELGDVVWYVSALSYDLGLRLQNCYDNALMDDSVLDIHALHKNTVRTAGRVKKILRGDDFSDEKILDIQGYLGDILRRVESIATVNMESSLESICEANIDKLFDRQERGVLKGDGDER